MRRFTVGEEVYYHMIGEVDKVYILKVKKQPDVIEYTLKVLAVIRKSKIVFPPKVGATFKCSKKLHGSLGQWHLTRGCLER